MIKYLLISLLSAGVTGLYFWNRNRNKKQSFVSVHIGKWCPVCRTYGGLFYWKDKRFRIENELPYECCNCDVWMSESYYDKVILENPDPKNEPLAQVEKLSSSGDIEFTHELKN